MQVAKRKVLIVEDEFILYDELVDFFEEKGYAVIKYDSGKAVDDYDSALALLKNEAPDIAVIDVCIKGNKDGLELAAYIKEHFYTLIVILTAYDNTENLERARLISPDGFVLKADKPLNKNQLWASICVKLPKLVSGDMRKRQGIFSNVKEIDTSALHKKNKESTTQYHDPVDRKTLIRYETISHIVSYNAKSSGDGNNNVLIYVNDNKGYIMRSTMSEIIDKLPSFFIRVDKSTIVNLHQVTAKGKAQNLFYIGEMSFRIGDTYKTEALEKIKLELGDKF